MKNVTKAAIAGTAGLALLLGGGATLAYWTDTATGSDVEIVTGNLDLGTIADGSGWALQQNATGVSPAEAASVVYTDQLLVPGDTLTKTVDVPVTLTGENIKATLAVTAATDPAALPAALTAEVVSINGVAGTATLGATTGTVPVVFRVVIPWTAEYNDNKSLTTTFTAQYTLTQIPEATP